MRELLIETFSFKLQFFFLCLLQVTNQIGTHFRIIIITWSAQFCVPFHLEVKKMDKNRTFDRQFKCNGEKKKCVSAFGCWAENKFHYVLYHQQELGKLDRIHFCSVLDDYCPIEKGQILFRATRNDPDDKQLMFFLNKILNRMTITF